MHPDWLPDPGWGLEHICSSPHGARPSDVSETFLKHFPRLLSSLMDRNDPACCSQP